MTLLQPFKNISNFNKVRIVQAILYLITIYTLLLFFNTTLFLLGLVLSWFFFAFGVSISLHKYSSHRSFEPKNLLIKHFLLWCGTQTTLGTSLEFAAGHRTHHKHSDTDQDPFALTSSFKHNLKLWFLWFDTSLVNPTIIKDLTRDSTHKFYHRNYWKIWAIYPVVLLIINPLYVCYFFALPVVYCLLGMSWVTVIAHSPTLQKFFIGSKTSTQDLSWNSVFFTVLFAGEGYHEIHHQFPGISDYGIKNNRLDVSGKLINVLGNPNTV